MKQDQCSNPITTSISGTIPRKFIKIACTIFDVCYDSVQKVDSWSWIPQQALLMNIWWDSRDSTPSYDELVLVIICIWRKSMALFPEQIHSNLTWWYGGTELTPWEIYVSNIDFYISFVNNLLLYISIIDLWSQ